jgi:outer membrane receptor protein involved in Fe transport
LVCSAGIVALSAGVALAQSASFALPAEPLSDSLRAVAKQSGQNILFTPQAVAGVRAPALRGEMSGPDAVNVLLKGTNLEAAPDGDEGLIVRVAGGARRGEIERPVNLRLASISSSDGQSVVSRDPSLETILAQNIAPAPAAAPPAEPTATNVEQVVVSASRISIAGYQQPTPVTMVGSAQLDSAANADIGDTIRNLPAVGISSSPLKAGGGTSIFNPVAGLSTVNLRDLGVVRTLVLFDGQRVVQSNVSGGVDLGTIPSTLVKRIDVVTGGASAAWGSDAVAGVVNLILDKTFTGFKADIHGSDTGQDNRRAYGLEASYGFDFDGDRGHIIVSGDYQDSPQTVFIGQAKWWKSTFLLQNPAYTPTNGAVQYRHYTNVGQQATQGGAFLTGPLANLQFVGPNGTPTKYNPGVAFGTLAAGGSSNPYNSEIPTDELSYPYRTTTLFGFGSYRLTPEISASVQLNFGKGSSMNDSTADLRQGTNGIKIYNDNAYLLQINPSLAAMIPNGSPAILATTSTNNVDMHNPSFSAFQNSLGVPVNVVNRQLMRGVFSLDGALGNDWSWNAYYQHGESRVRSTPTHSVIDPNLNLATDAVFAPAGNALGVPQDTIVCRSSLSNPTNGCQPLNVFGEGVASQAAINYVNTDQNFQTMVLGEDVLSGSMQGILPWDVTGAGAPSVAFGAEYRKEAGRADISTLAQAKVLNVGNFGALLGHYSVAEGFIETDVPLIKNGIVDDLSVNAAGRITDYSTSGMVETWKIGATSQVNEDIRLRTTYSYDIRAPDLAELFQQGLVSQASPVDPTLVPPRSVVSFTNQSGNPSLLPEKAFTLSGGVVLTPHWIEGLQLSFDWYNINVKGYISTPTAAQESNFCLAGSQFYCSQFVHNPDGSLKWELLTPQNASSLTTSGLDFQADYSMEFLGGTLGWHLLGNYTDEETISAFGQIPVDYAGQLGSFTGNTAMPKLKGSLSATYVEGPWSATVQGRFIGSGRLQNTWTSGVQVDDNSVPAIGYLDLRGSYNWNENIQLYGAIDNITDVPPPTIATLGNASNVSLDINTNAGIYDILGRTIRGGVRFKF